jgi:hypothetical protein
MIARKGVYFLFIFLFVFGDEKKRGPEKNLNPSLDSHWKL